MNAEYDVVIVGGGIAGMNAALTSARLGLTSAIVTGDIIGGQLVSIDKIEGIPGFPEPVAGYDFCPITQELADAAGVEFMTTRGETIAAEGDRWRVTGSDDSFLARAVIIATGTALAKLDVPGEEQFAGKGVSECASCDAPLLRNKIAVVVGGGDTGMQEALTLADHVAKVVIIERGAALTGQKSYRDRVSDNPKIEFKFGSVVTAIGGEQTVSSVRIRDVGTGTETDLETSAVFACIGLVPNTELVRDLVALDATGRIVVDAGMRTAVKGLCAAGNVRAQTAHRAAGAMGDGATAALAIERYLGTGEWWAA